MTIRLVPSVISGRQLALAPWLAFLIWANLKTPMWADDYCRALDSSIGGAIAGAWNTYFTWSGRFFVTAITNFVMGTGWRWSMLPFDVVNASITLGTILIVQRLAALASGTDKTVRCGRMREFSNTMLVALLVWWVPRSVGEAALWKTGTIGYLWAVAGELLVLERVVTFALRRTVPTPLWLLAPFAFIMATFLEPLSALMSTILVLIAIQMRHMRQPARWLFIVAVAHVAGSAVLIGAPGNFVRAAIVAHSVGVSSFPERLSSVFSSLSSGLADGYSAIALLMVMLPFIVPACVVGREQVTRVYSRIPFSAGYGWVFVVLALVYAATLLAIPSTALLAARVTYPGSIFIACYISSLFRLRPFSPKTEVTVAAVLGTLTLATLVNAVPAMQNIAEINHAWIVTLEKQPKNTSVTLPMILSSRHHALLAYKDHFFSGFSRDKNYFVNACYAKAWSMASIVGKQ